MENPTFLIIPDVRETWSMRVAAVQNKEPLRLEHSPDCYLAQISLWKGTREHDLHSDGSLKGLAIPTVWAKMLGCELLSTAAAFCKLYNVMEISNGEPRQNSLENSEYTITLKECFAFLSKNLAWTQQQWRTQSNHHQKRVVVYCPAIGGQNDSRCIPSIHSFSVVESHRMLVINGVWVEMDMRARVQERKR